MMKADWKRMNLQNDDGDRKEEEGGEDREEEGSDYDGLRKHRSRLGAVSEEQGAPRWAYIQMSNEDRLALLRREKLKKLLCFLPEDRY
jgi:hypothetical protein